MPGGRPTKLTPEVHAQIVRYLATGCYLETAAGAAGIDRMTLHRWLRRGEKATKGIYHDFCDAVTQARDGSEIRAVGQVARAASEDWRAAAWFLEHGRQDRWKRSTKIEVTVEQDKTETIEAILNGVYGVDDEPED